MGRESSSPVDEPTGGDEPTAAWSERISDPTSPLGDNPHTLAATPAAMALSQSAVSLEASPDDLVGRTLGGSFQILRVIGEGGTGRVYEAQHTRIGKKRFAVKVLHAEYLRHPEAWVRFQREAEAAASIDHPRW